MEKKVIVVGAGVIGLSTAVVIKQRCPNVAVEIVADQFSPHTTSDGSGGFWEPFAVGDTDLDLIREVSKDTFIHLKHLAYSAHAAKSGASALSGYGLWTTVVEKPEFFHDIVDGYRALTSEELAQFPRAKSGFFFTTMQVDVATYLPWLMTKFKSMGGKVRCAKLKSLDELYGQCDIVVNCCGIGARDLLNDTEITPIRGQTIRVRAPWVKHFYMLNETGDGAVPVSYCLPGTKSICVGGTADKGDWSTVAKDDTRDKIWKAATDLLPMLKDAEMIKSWAGLRPGRSALRLEKEYLPTSKGLIKVIHNYGHGGAGVTLHWGCAVRSSQMVSEELNMSQSGRAKL